LEGCCRPHSRRDPTATDGRKLLKTNCITLVFLPPTFGSHTQSSSPNPLKLNGLRCPLPTPLPIGTARRRREVRTEEGRKQLKIQGFRRVPNNRNFWRGTA
jgi:hypothetical protein